MKVKCFAPRGWATSTVVALLLATACSPKEATHNEARGPKARAAGDIARRELPKMTSLQLTVAPTVADVLVGESLDVEVKLKNLTAAVAQVHGPDQPSQFEFILRPKDERQGVLVLSAAAALLARLGEPVVLPTELGPLDPGAQLTYKEDLSKYALDGIPVGQYGLSVAYRVQGERIESEAVPLSVAIPRVSQLAVLSGPSESRLATVFAHGTPGKEIAIFQRESFPEAPNDAVSFRRRTTAAPGCTGVAAAMELDQNQGVRWGAWLEGQALGGAVSEQHTLYVLVEPVPTTLKSPVLQTVGWQPTVNEAAFALLGTNAEAKPTLALLSFSARTKQGTVQTVPLPISEPPAFWRARRREKAGVPVQYDLVTALPAAGGVRVQATAVCPDTGTAAPPTLLAARQEPLAALTMYAVATDQPGVVDALFGPGGNPSRMTFLRLPLAGGKPILEQSFPIQAGPGIPSPTGWALSPEPQATPTVLAKVGEEIVAWALADGQVRRMVLADESAQATHLRLEVVGEELWAIWADPASGLRHRKVPQ